MNHALHGVLPIAKNEMDAIFTVEFGDRLLTLSGLHRSRSSILMQIQSPWPSGRNLGLVDSLNRGVIVVECINA